MKPARPASPEQYTLMSRFQDVCRELRHSGHHEKLERPLGYWALPRDRRLPYALLGRKLGELVNAPFAELSSTPGIGPKKIASLVMLMERAAAGAAKIDTQDAAPASIPTPAANIEFDPELVSETDWELWCDTVRRFGLSGEMLGRLVPTLQTLPTVIWKTPLKRYLNLSLAEVRTLKTHGDKRVRAVLEVFYTVNQVLDKTHPNSRLTVQPTPTFVVPIEYWIRDELNDSESASLEDFRQHLALPLLNQIERDAGETVHRLAAGRMGIEGPPETVREQARRMGVTRARIYQLLETCSLVMDVRWPHGRWWFNELVKKLQEQEVVDERLQLLTTIRLLAFPDKVGQELPDAVLV